jgi:hypothetical protein
MLRILCKRFKRVLMLASVYTVQDAISDAFTTAPGDERTQFLPLPGTAALTTGPEFPQTLFAGSFAVNRFADRIQNGQPH